jgi:ubiquinone/menaquinone biosynthesis C-methylase UbiE
VDRWKYYDIVHQRHLVMNPVEETKLEILYDLLELNPNDNVIDIGCGKGEMLIKLAEKYGIKGLGIDKSPYCIRDAQKRKTQRTPQAELRFLEMDGAQYKPENGESFDLAMCIGATWIYGGYRTTLKALRRMTRTSGHVMVGEPFWRVNPPKEYLQSEGLSADSFDTHHGNVRTGQSEGMRLVFTLVSSQEDWDRSEGLHWSSAAEYALAHPKDPDLEELLARDSKERESYLKWGRDTLGWAIYLFRKMP